MKICSPLFPLTPSQFPSTKGKHFQGHLASVFLLFASIFLHALFIFFLFFIKYYILISCFGKWCYFSPSQILQHFPFKIIPFKIYHIFWLFSANISITTSVLFTANFELWDDYISFLLSLSVFSVIKMVYLFFVWLDFHS